MLEISAEVRDAVVSHAVSMLPNEACGLLSAPRNLPVLTEFHPITNTANSPTRFALDVAQMLETEASIDQRDRELVGVLHSHPTTSAYPSATDVADAQAYDPSATFVHLIVSLRHAEPEMRAYRILDDGIVELPVVLAEDRPTAHDQAGAIAAVARLPRPPVKD